MLSKDGTDPTWGGGGGGGGDLVRETLLSSSSPQPISKAEVSPAK